MHFDEFQKHIDLFDQKVIEKYGMNSPSKNERILARITKLGEEFGELCNEVLALHGDQRPDKLEKRDDSSIGNELADVIITTMLLAKSLDIDMQIALTKKIEKINKRFL